MTLYPVYGLDGPYGTYTAVVNEANGIDAGNFVKPSGSTEATTTTYKRPVANSLILVSDCDANGDEALVCGIALDDQATNGQTVSVATQGIFLFQASAAVTQGNAVCQVASAASFKVKQAEAGGRPIGIALTSCSAGDEYVLVLVTGFGKTGAEA